MYMIMENLLHHLTALEAELHHHGILCTPLRLEKLLHYQFHEVGQSGSPYNRETVIRYLSSCSEAQPTRSNNHAVQILGEKQALLTYFSASTQPSGDTLYTWRSSIWVNENEGWQLLYHQGTPASAASINNLREQGKLP
ncbi:DUF4440 domain-containing protein [Neisseria sp.]|uniref:nuclear transport factor 2 family protein n=1 Tax=Neisseria sp. TaxID=192066 RepID=UPI00289A00D7|nr:DUF4440 domain-containing protein [Neisseria sp.]